MKKPMASKIKKQEERCSHLEAKYDKLIEMYSSLLDGAGSGIVPDNPAEDHDAGFNTIPRRHPKGGRRNIYSVMEFARYLLPKPLARSKDGRPVRDHAAHETMTVDEHACRKCSFPLSMPTAKYEKTTEDLVNRQWQKTSWEIIWRYCKKCRRQQTVRTDGVLPNEHYRINIRIQQLHYDAQ